MLPPVYQTLMASPVGAMATGGIRRHNVAGQSAKAPYITWFLLSSVPENQLSGLPPVDRATVQIDCWHRDDAGVEALATAVRDAVEPHAHLTSIPIDDWEPETRLFRIGLQFDWLLPRSGP